MDALRISRLHAHYRVPATAPDAASRLDGVLRAVLEEGMENALARSSVPVHEEICIRTLHAPVRLKAASPDSTLIGAWSVGLAESIQRRLQDGGPDVVRYRTRNHALVDLLQGVAAGDFRHAWAWRTLGLWTLDDQPSQAAAGGEAVRALLAHGESVVAALSGAARSGALPGLVGALPHSAWPELVRAALGASAISPDRARRLLSETGADLGVPAPARERGDGAGGASALGVTERPPTPPEPAHAPDGEGASLASRAMRIARRSEIARAVGALPTAHERMAHSLAVLAVLETDPSALQGEDAWTSRLVEHVLQESLGMEERPPSGPDHPAHAPLRPERTDVPWISAGAPEAPGAPEPGPTPAAPGRAPAPTDTERAHDTPGRSDQAPDDHEALPAPHADAAGAVTTEWGGLLFLLHVVDELGLPGEILAAEVFRPRSLPWVLHGLAGSLLDLEAGDPAAAAFAGVVPGRPAPWDGDDPATPAEARALEELAQRVARRVHERLVGEAPPDARAAAATVRACARRRAELLCETGWFDVLLRLDEVVVETRRAGLDLDPGWIPWLGAVVRFVYV